ncbi:MAG TPA: DNA translocase FtsK, partial [bacterium]|nr:DNA translocase FtsK [bacterium]
IQISTRPADFIETATAREDDEEQDKLWDEVIEYLKKNRSCSASMLQRKFKIGYNRASRLVDQLEAAGIVGPGDGAKPRDVLLPED